MSRAGLKGFVSAAAWILCTLLAGKWVEAAPQALLWFPISDPEMEEINAEMELALSSLSGVRPFKTPDGEKMLTSCKGDELCLAELVRLSGASVGMYFTATKTEDRIELQIFAVQATTAQVRSSVSLRVHPSDLGSALRSSLRKLLVPPDARLAFEVQPPWAEVRFFGGPPVASHSGPWWSGRWVLTVEAEGYLPESTRILLLPGERRVLGFELKPLKRPVLAAPIEPTAPLGEPPDWGLWARRATLGGGALVVAVGAIVMVESQSSYNGWASAERFDGTQATAAAAARSSDRSQYQVGSTLVFTGAAALGVALVWSALEGF